MVSASEVSRLTAVLESNGFRLVSGVSGRGCVRDGEDNLVDIGTVSFDEEGRGVYRGGKGGEVRFSSDAFRGHGSIGDVEVRCLTPEAQMQAHSGYEPSPKDAHDVRLLCEAFGLTALPPYRD